MSVKMEESFKESLDKLFEEAQQIIHSPRMVNSQGSDTLKNYKEIFSSFTKLRKISRDEKNLKKAITGFLEMLKETTTHWLPNETNVGEMLPEQEEILTIFSYLGIFRKNKVDYWTIFLKATFFFTLVGLSTTDIVTLTRDKRFWNYENIFNDPEKINCFGRVLFLTPLTKIIRDSLKTASIKLFDQTEKKMTPTAKLLRENMNKELSEIGDVHGTADKLFTLQEFRLAGLLDLKNILDEKTFAENYLIDKDTRKVVSLAEKRCHVNKLSDTI